MTPCTCTTHTHCPTAAALWQRVAELWRQYRAVPSRYREMYFEATAEYLAHRDEHGQQEQGREALL